jgi:nitroreductase
MQVAQLLEIIKSRRSVRYFTDKKIDDLTVSSLIEAARLAPSAGNLQPLEIIIVRDEQVKFDLSMAAFGQEFISLCSIVFVMCANIQRTSARYAERGESLYTIQDIAAATQNILLLAHSLGLGSCWVGAFDEEKVKSICNLPAHIRPMVMIALGYPDEKTKSSVPTRKEVNEFVRYNSW